MIGGVGVASLAVGVITGILTIGKKSTVDKLCSPTCFEKDRTAVLDAESAGKTLSSISTITFIAGGVGLAAGVVLVLTSGPRRAPTTATLGAMPLPGGGALSLGGSF